MHQSGSQIHPAISGRELYENSFVPLVVGEINFRPTFADLLTKNTFYQRRRA